ncbi:MAG: DNA polymerase Y family protein [Planctomycetes bacterium]|nr:DNA polymerase Y family protein [Planctomycetota bacterium]
MDRMACVDVPAFPLQILLRRHPEWRRLPAAVVDRDRPQGILLWVNEKARTLRVLPGQRFATALSLARDLRAAEVPSNEIERAVAATADRLRRFTPGVEPADGEPGVFWLDASGLEPLFRSLRRWASLLRADLADAGFAATLVVGFDRFGTYAVAKSSARSGLVLFDDAASEREAARRIPLDRLALPPSVRDALWKLGVRTVGAFVDLPPRGIESRFGEVAHRLHRLASGALALGLSPAPPAEVFAGRCLLDYGEADAMRLLVVVEDLLRPILAALARAGRAVLELRLGLVFEREGERTESLRPAAPTLDAAQLLDLVRIRLESIDLLHPAVEVSLDADAATATREQLDLFRERPRRDVAAANRALARLRADFGADAVSRAALRDGHLPEGRFSWEALDRLAQAVPRDVAMPPLIRRIYAEPVPLPTGSRRDVGDALGSYVVSGGWWRRTVDRAYHFAETNSGDVLWLFYDRIRRRWYLQGRLE